MKAAVSAVTSLARFSAAHDPRLKRRGHVSNLCGRAPGSLSVHSTLKKKWAANKGKVAALSAVNVMGSSTAQNESPSVGKTLAGIGVAFDVKDTNGFARCGAKLEFVGRCAPMRHAVALCAIGGVSGRAAVCRQRQRAHCVCTNREFPIAGEVRGRLCLSGRNGCCRTANDVKRSVRTVFI